METANADLLTVPVTLRGQHVRLEPLSLEHHAALCAVGLDPELWRWTVSQVKTADDMRAYIEAALKLQTAGEALPFAIIANAGERIVGSTRFGSIDRANRRVEIGWTWIGRDWQRTAINTEAKYLLLGYAFEKAGCIRVEFKTDALNEKSRTALLRIGAREEGIFRSHMITETGRIRDSVYFSIIASEWPGVRNSLERKLTADQGSIRR